MKTRLKYWIMFSPSKFPKGNTRHTMFNIHKLKMILHPLLLTNFKQMYFKTDRQIFSLIK